ncbi:MAG TPA: OmpA family protein [Gemmatimonadaceae bacterium]|nr:OmpA family protein [Gemmatimonadaceae bacterium]
MHRAYRQGVALVVFAPLVLGACATKGYVRKQVAAQAVITDSALVAERNARTAADQEHSTAIAQLRTDLDAMRKDFGAKIAQVEDGLRFALPVTFGFNEDGIREENKAALTRFATVAQKYYPGSTITVEGFADPAGTARYNLELSRRRAENVRGFLTTQGMDGSALRVVGMGETRLVVNGATHDEPGAEQNRRVVFVIENAGTAPSGIAMATP